MIHNDIQNQLQLLVKGTAQPLIEVADHPVETPQWAVGQRLPAHVIASLPNGRFQVQIENQILDMNLPRNTQAGETLELTYTGNSPRLTFVLDPSQATVPHASAPPTGDDVKLTISSTGADTKANSQISTESATEATKPNVGLSATALSRTAETPAGAPVVQRGLQPSIYIADAPVALSAAAKFIGTLQHQSPGEASQAPVSIKSSPVLNAPPEHATPLAEALSKTLSQSGLFYESHQLQWISGERSLAALQQEPQAQLSSAATAQSSGLPSGQNGVLLSPDSTDAAINAHTLPLVQQQLGVLDSRQVVWQGQVWPGQEMRWEIEEDDHGRRTEADAPPAWKTRLRLELPRLGGVAANIALTANGVRIDFSVVQDKSAALLKREQIELVHSFDAAGLSLTAVTVNQNEQAA